MTARPRRASASCARRRRNAAGRRRGRAPARSRRTARTPWSPALCSRRRRALPDVHEPLGRIRWRCGEMRPGSSQTVAFGRRIADRHAVDVRQARQQSAIEQRQRGAVLAAIPQRARRGADVGRQALRPDVEIAHVRRRARTPPPRRPQPAGRSRRAEVDASQAGENRHARPTPGGAPTDRASGRSRQSTAATGWSSTAVVRCRFQRSVLIVRSVAEVRIALHLVERRARSRPSGRPAPTAVPGRAAGAHRQPAPATSAAAPTRVALLRERTPELLFDVPRLELGAPVQIHGETGRDDRTARRTDGDRSTTANWRCRAPPTCPRSKIAREVRCHSGRREPEDQREQRNVRRRSRP